MASGRWLHVRQRLSRRAIHPRHVIAYDDGEVRQEFSLVFHAHLVGGELRTSSETRRVHWVAPEKIDGLNIHRSMRLRIEHALENRSKPYLS